jgi:hypothetical protein
MLTFEHNVFLLDFFRKFGFIVINPLNAELNPMCHLLALLGVNHIFHVSWLRVNGRKRIVYVSGISHYCE